MLKSNCCSAFLCQLLFRLLVLISEPSEPQLQSAKEARSITALGICITFGWSFFMKLLFIWIWCTRFTVRLPFRTGILWFRLLLSFWFTRPIFRSCAVIGSRAVVRFSVIRLPAAVLITVFTLETIYTVFLNKVGIFCKYLRCYSFHILKRSGFFTFLILSDHGLYVRNLQVVPSCRVIHIGKPHFLFEDIYFNTKSPSFLCI